MTRPPVFCFAVQSDASASALPRVLEVFALHGLVPSRLHGQCSSTAGGDMGIEIQLTGVDADQANLLAKRLGRIIGVRDVLWSRKLGVGAI